MQAEMMHRYINTTMLLPLHSMTVVEWVAVPQPGTHRILISLGAVVSWSGGWDNSASEWEVPGLLFLLPVGV